MRRRCTQNALSLNYKILYKFLEIVIGTGFLKVERKWKECLVPLFLKVERKWKECFAPLFLKVERKWK
jgi:hypothetical protein